MVMTEVIERLADYLIKLCTAFSFLNEFYAKTQFNLITYIYVYSYVYIYIVQPPFPTWVQTVWHWFPMWQCVVFQHFQTLNMFGLYGHMQCFIG